MYKKNNKKHHTFLGLCLGLALLFVFGFSLDQAYAQSLTDSIKIEQKISIDSPYAKPKDSFSYVLEGLGDNTPLENKQKIFSLKGDSSKQIDISYTRPGEYSFKLYQEKTDIENVDYDKEVYYIYVTITENKGKLQKTLEIIKNSSEKKVSNIVFNNAYKLEEEDDQGNIHAVPGNRPRPGETEGENQSLSPRPGKNQSLSPRPGENQKSNPGLRPSPNEPQNLNPNITYVPSESIVIDSTGGIRKNESKIIAANNRPTISKNAKTGVEAYIGSLLLLILVSAFLLLIIDQKTKKEAN